MGDLSPDADRGRARPAYSMARGRAVRRLECASRGLCALGAFSRLGRDLGPAAFLHAPVRDARAPMAVAVASRLCDLHHPSASAGRTRARMAVRRRAAGAEIPCHGDRDLPCVLPAGGPAAQSSRREQGFVGRIVSSEAKNWGPKAAAGLVAAFACPATEIRQTSPEKRRPAESPRRRGDRVMFKRLPVLLKAASYAFRGGFLIRPFLIVLALATAGTVLSGLEEQYPGIRAFIPQTLFPSQADPQVAQAILTSIATSTMTVVSIVFAILLMTLTLASTQFSPRILVSFVRDHVTQWTLGIFLGTFSYCIAALPAARSLPTPFAPVVTVVGAMALAPACVAWIIYFIHHISIAISVNHIVDRIRRETELVIDDLMPDRRRPSQRDETAAAFSVKLEFAIKSRQSGYIRYVHIERLRQLAKAYRICLRVERRVGHFVPEGVTLIKTSHRERVTDGRLTELLAAIHIGPTRTLQQDVEFGIVQIVDIALRAISPAVNDPTTAISCVDQLSC